MAKTEINWPDYIRYNTYRVIIRSNKGVDWTEAASFTLDEAEDMADYVKRQVDTARRNNPDIQELAEDLSDAEAEVGDDAWEDIALTLYRKGYRKQ